VEVVRRQLPSVTIFVLTLVTDKLIQDKEKQMERGKTKDSHTGGEKATARVLLHSELSPSPILSLNTPSTSAPIL